MTAAIPLRVRRLERSRLAEVVAVHCDAFRDYPTLRFVLGDGDEPFGERLAALIGYFLDTTAARGGAFFGIEDGDGLTAAADAVFSATPEPPAFARRREALWRRLGDGARSRYEAYSAVTRPFEPEAPHYYLSMLGVRSRAAGQGLARPLLEAVHALSASDRRSRGVALETEEARNVSFYQHFGYRLVGHGQVEGGVESWGFFRPDR